MFEAPSHLEEQIASLLEGIRLEAGGRYACLLDEKRLLCETPAGTGDLAALRSHLLARATALLAIPGRMADGAEMEDLFEGWPGDEFLLGFVNARVAMVLACQDAEPLKDDLLPALRALADLLFRYDARYRLDEKGRGLFLGRGRIDVIVVGGEPEAPGAFG